MSIDARDSESVDFDPPELGRMVPPATLAAAAGGKGGRAATLSERLKRLSAERLAEILIGLTTSQGPEVKRLVDAALRQFPDALMSAQDTGLEAKAPAAEAAPAPRHGGPLLDEATLRQAIQHHRHNVSNVARALGVSRMTVYRSMRRYDIT